MTIKRYKGSIGSMRRLGCGGDIMSNVLVMEKYIENSQVEECEWDIISDIFSKAIKRKGLKKEQVHEISNKILSEVRKK